MPQTTIVRLRGGPADETEATVRVIAGTLPRYLGVGGGNYVLDHESFGVPSYNWVPIHVVPAPFPDGTTLPAPRPPS